MYLQKEMRAHGPNPQLLRTPLSLKELHRFATAENLAFDVSRVMYYASRQAESGSIGSISHELSGLSSLKKTNGNRKNIVAFSQRTICVSSVSNFDGAFCAFCFIFIA